MKKFILLLSAFAAFAAALPAVADIGVTVNGKDISAGYGQAPSWSYNINGNKILALAETGPYVISGNNGTNTVSIRAWANCTIVASNLVIDNSGAGVSALSIGTNSCDVTLLLSGTNTFTSGGKFAGVSIGAGSSSLTISNLEAAAALFVRGGSDGGAGIGGDVEGTCGTVTIAGGTIIAAGGPGGGTVVDSDDGGAVIVTPDGAGIGGGYRGDGGAVTISGGTVTATGGTGGADIGYGVRGSSSGANTFTGGSILLAHGAASLAPSNGTARVWCVTFPYVTTASALADLTAGLARLSPAYGVNGIVARDGKVYAWLPDGDYSFTTDSGVWRATVNGAATAAIKFIGIFVNGIDIGTGSGANPAWTFDGTNLALTASGATYVISGNNNGNPVSIHAQANCTVVASNLTVDVSGKDNVTAFDCGTNAVTLALWSEAGTTNTFKSGSSCAGIRTTDGSLAITNLNGSAALLAQGGMYGAGIGGGAYRAGGTVTISGGTVSAIGGYYGAGIGGGLTGSGGTVTISGGSVSATGCIGGAGIGGGQNCAGGTVTVSGGTVTAIGGSDAAGIGGGHRGDGGAVTISGGTVSATGGYYGAGVGGGNGGAGGTVTVFGGTVIATGDHANGAEDIGTGFSATNSGAKTFTGGSIILANGTISLAPSNGTARVWCVTFTNVTSAAALADLTNALAALEYGVRDIMAPGGKVCAWLPSGTSCFTFGGQLMKLVVDENGNSSFQPFVPVGVTVNGRDIAYASGGSAEAGNAWSYNGSDLSLSGFGSYVVSGANGTNDVSLYASGTTPSLVLSNLTIDVSAFPNRAALRYNGSFWTELLMYGKNTLKSGSRRAGVESMVATRYLMISGKEPSAELVAQGGGDGAGIGGAQSNDCGTVVIYGGIITAAGKSGGSGIGGGAYGNGGNVKIFGGLVTASGGNGAAGIGGGWDGNGGTLEVCGGTVRAIRGDRGSVSAFYDIGGEIDHGTSTFTSGANTFTGGSVWPANGLIAGVPSNGTERVFCVTNSGFTANAHLVVVGLPTTYGVNDIYADAGGKVYLWLPAGGYIEGGTAAAGSFLQGFGVSGTGAVTGPTNVTLAITGFTPEAGVTNWTPKALSAAHVETIYATNLTNAVWSPDRPTNAPALFLKLRVR